MSRLAAAVLAACCAGSVSWSGALLDPPPTLSRVTPALPDLHAPAWAERWLYNPRERTATGIDALRDGRRDDGVEALDTALRRAPDDPRTLYNAGTGRLFAKEQPKKAAALLERAATEAPPDLAPRAFYNLGNARLATGDAAGAVEAYRQSLRLEPSLGPAKRNLEIALARLDRDRPKTRSPQEAPGGERSGKREQSDRSEGTEPQEQKGSEAQNQQQQGSDQASGARPSPSQTPSRTQGEAAGGEGQDADRVGQAGAPGPGAPSQKDQPLLHFDDQADMTAAEASALLDAIDQLERTERRRAARARAEAKGESTEEDW